MEENSAQFNWVVDDSCPEWKRKWWYKIVKNKVEGRKGKRIQVYTHEDYMSFKQALTDGWLSVERKEELKGKISSSQGKWHEKVCY